MDISKAYGNFIKGKRIEKNLTQAEVAKMLGISQVAYGRYELGSREPNFDLLMRISYILEFRPSEFFDGYMSSRLSWYADKVMEKNDSDNR